MMKVVFLTHLAEETPGAFLEWCQSKSYSYSIVRLFLEEKLPQLEDFDVLIVMGGPMSVHDDLEWLSDERKLISSAIKANKMVVGVCLGAQQIAVCLGAEVTSMDKFEIGWGPVEINGKSYDVFHWHGEEFSLPEGAVRIASNENCLNQGFRLGQNVLALQFHVEVTSEIISGLIEKFKPDVQTLGWEESEKCRAANELIDTLL